jgi:hypothetical protein
MPEHETPERCHRPAARQCATRPSHADPPCPAATSVRGLRGTLKSHGPDRWDPSMQYTRDPAMSALILGHSRLSPHSRRPESHRGRRGRSGPARLRQLGCCVGDRVAGAGISATPACRLRPRLRRGTTVARPREVRSSRTCEIFCMPSLPRLGCCRRPGCRMGPPAALPGPRHVVAATGVEQLGGRAP